MAKEELKAIRKDFLDKMETRLRESSKPEDDLFYYHPNEDHIVLSHALFWMMIPLMAFWTIWTSIAMAKWYVRRLNGCFRC